MTPSAQFRSPREYEELLTDFLTSFVYKHKLKATDIVVLATALGVMGTGPIRRNLKVKDFAEHLIQIGMTLGKEIVISFQKKMKAIQKPVLGEMN